MEKFASFADRACIAQTAGAILAGLIASREMASDEELAKKAVRLALNIYGHIAEDLAGK
jgi:hypothetical protein